MRTGWVVRVHMRPSIRNTPDEMIVYDCLCLIQVRANEPVHMMIPEGIAGVVLTLCLDAQKGEHMPLPMTLAKLPSEAN